MRILNRWGRFFDAFLWICAIGSGVVLVAVTLITDYGVVMRYGFRFGSTWVDEVVDILLIYLTFLGVAWLLKENVHVSIDVIYDRLSSRTKLIIDLAIAVVCIILCPVIAWFGVQITLESFQNNVSRQFSVLGTPRGLMLAPIPFGFFLLTIQFARNIYNSVIRLRNEDRSGRKGRV